VAQLLSRYLLMPERVKKLEGQVEVVASTLEELNAALKKIDRSVDDNLAPTLLRKRRSEIVEKYVPVRQPIAKRPPEGVYLPRLMWNICKRRNDEGLEGQ